MLERQYGCQAPAFDSIRLGDGPPEEFRIMSLLEPA
ncbi:hypothetical protein FraEuI1c_6939 [Pseudofrankia inefficax]|uniref:Uncharacterized protein n=1 Tax=Pseudofrankia inefficax (strain DSM 45817 / CECT 9037 / DDB 130130 / EuI1c) TaxID=298654 RepID=E3IVX9_PSEI1|nr:hypothetical protein FraEuI1c_6939 [Pseudofrankia inefficax]